MRVYLIIFYTCIHDIVYCLSAKTSQTELQMLIAKYPRHVKIKHLEKIKDKSALFDIIRHLAIPMSGKRLLRCEYYLLQIVGVLRLSLRCVDSYKYIYKGRYQSATKLPPWFIMAATGIHFINVSASKHHLKFKAFIRTWFYCIPILYLKSIRNPYITSGERSY